MYIPTYMNVQLSRYKHSGLIHTLQTFDYHLPSDFPSPQNRIMKAVATLRLLHTNSAISHLQLSRLLDLYERRWAKLITGNTYVRSYVWHTIICRRNDARGVNPVLVWVRQYDNFIICVMTVGSVLYLLYVACSNAIILLC